MTPEEIEKDEAVFRCKCHTLMEPIYGGLRCPTCGHQVPMREPEWGQMVGQVKEQAAEIERLRAAVETIAKGEGPFSRDRLEHATNTIEAMKKTALTALRGREESDEA